QSTDSMPMLIKDLDKLQESGYKYIFIDEITVLTDFINSAAILSDIYGSSGMKIVISGADSLIFAMASRYELYDRNVMVHTSYIPFWEYSRLFKVNSIDKYIEYGGLSEETSFQDYESTCKYIDTAVSRNIQHALKNHHYGDNVKQLIELDEDGELTKVINLIVEKLNYEFVLGVAEEKLDNVEYGKVLLRLKDIVSAKAKDKTIIKLTKELEEKVNKYLVTLDLMVSCLEISIGGKRQDRYIITQPGMRYSIAKALVCSLMQDEYFSTLSEDNKKYIANKILDCVKCKMLEDIILLEVTKTCPRNRMVFKLLDEDDGFYMVTYDNDENSCAIYEINHSDKIADSQARYLTDEDWRKLIENKFGKITGKYVLYRGKDTKVGEVQYLNVEKYLIGLN
ncbi:MAG: ATP-binding protein, partial [Candidatus Coproplasma sp.]